MVFNPLLVKFLVPVLVFAAVANACSTAVIWLLTTRITGRREFWIPFSVIAGPVAVLVFVIWAVYSGSLAATMALGERHKIDKVLRALTGRREATDAVQDYGIDDYAEKLLADGRLEEALTYVNERLQIAHERGSGRAEMAYREYLMRIQEQQREAVEAQQR